VPSFDPRILVAHAVDREYRVMSALAGTNVPVAKMLALCEDASVIGTAFYLMVYVEGRVLWDPTLPGMTPAQRPAHYDELNRVVERPVDRLISTIQNCSEASISLKLAGILYNELPKSLILFISTQDS
jgi:hypothetical protein